MKERRSVFITVKASPHPSKTQRESICTAGIDKDGNFIRLYPFAFRMMSQSEQFSKYQWIDVDVEKRTRDPRPESYKAYAGSVVLGEKITHKDWEGRRKIVGRLKIDNMCDLNSGNLRSIKTLAIIKPKEVLSFIAQPSSRDWTGKEEDIAKRLWLIDQNRPRLKKVPYDFKYKFKCHHPDCNGHEMKIEDWEVTALYWKLIHNNDSEETVLKKIQDKFFDDLCSTKRDIHFFVGMHSRFPTWFIIGLFCPPKAKIKNPQQLKLL